LNQILQAEFAEHLENTPGNHRNGKITKRVTSSQGELSIETPRDRSGSFEPQIIAKRQRSLKDELGDKIIDLYSRGATLEDIQDHLKSIYEVDMSKSLISKITDRILPELEAWENRPLEAVYPIVWFDALHLKIRKDNHIVCRAVYFALGVNSEGYRELLGMYIGDRESSKFWLGVLNNLYNRGVEDILIACTDNLPGFTKVIKAVFPQAQTQLCIVHQIRNSLKYATREDQRELAKDLKPIYQALNESEAFKALEEFKRKWDEHYPVAVNQWYQNWDNLTHFLKFNFHIRRLIYTTNHIENFNRQARAVTKKRIIMPNEISVKKVIYLMYKNMCKKKRTPVKKWGLIKQQLEILFPKRMKATI